MTSLSWKDKNEGKVSPKPITDLKGCYRRMTNLHIYLANQMTLTVLLARKPPSAHLIHSVFEVEDKLANSWIRIAFDATTMLQWTMMLDGRGWSEPDVVTQSQSWLPMGYMYYVHMT